MTVPLLAYIEWPFLSFKKTTWRQNFASSCAVENGPMRMRLDASGVSRLGLHASAVLERARIFNDDTPEGSRAGGAVCACGEASALLKWLLWDCSGLTSTSGDDANLKYSNTALYRVFGGHLGTLAIGTKTVFREWPDARSADPSRPRAYQKRESCHNPLHRV